MKILCVGHATYDITLLTNKYPVENEKLYVEGKVECGGGPASNAAYLLGLWDMDTTFLGTVGKDTYGKRIKEEFDSVNVNTKYLNYEGKTHTSLIISNITTGTRTILTYQNENIETKLPELDFIPDVILVDNHDCKLSVEVIKKYPNAISIMDAGRCTEEAKELSKIVNYVVCCHEFAEYVTGIKMNYDDKDNLASIYKKMLETYKNNVIVTLEDRGCLYCKDNKIKLMPSIKVQPIDSTGAGDIFHGAFTYGIANNYDIEEVLKIANITGALSVTKIGSRQSVPTKKEMKEAYNDFK